MLRLPTASRALSSSGILLKSSTRSTPRASQTLVSRATQQTRQQHAISNPTLANIEKRWETMAPQEQAELWMALRDRMTVDWTQMTLQEKKAAYWIAFGPHGPRAIPKPGEKWEVFRWVVGLVGASAVIFVAIRAGARPPPKTMTKEWQEASNEWMREQNMEAITGVSSPGYEGKGMVQSPPGPKKKPGEDEDDEE